MPSDPSSFHLRLSAALMKRIKVSAAENERSINAEIVARLERSFDLGEDARHTALGLLLKATKILRDGRGS